jgi:hypothetical protein
MSGLAERQLNQRGFKNQGDYVTMRAEALSLFDLEVINRWDDNWGDRDQLKRMIRNEKNRLEHLP